jgi:organic radical activating enzyme
MTTRYVLPYLGFSISDYCNLTCNGCNTLSNLGLKGNQLWDDYKSTIAQWKEFIDLEFWIIYGGEPTLNPSLDQWVHGILELWPNSKGQIWTNGHTITPNNKKLYNLVHSVKNKVELHVSLHSRLDFDKITNSVKNWLVGDIETTPIRKEQHDTTARYDYKFDLKDYFYIWQKSYNAIKADSWPECNSFDDWDRLPIEIQEECEKDFNLSPNKFFEHELSHKLVDANGITVFLKKENFFFTGPLKDQNSLKLHNSDPTIAHTVCLNTWCTEMYKGKIYKCVSLSKFFTADEQFGLDISDEDRKILRSYQAANIDMSSEDIIKFFENRHKVIEQCKFCPEERNFEEISPTIKKIKFIKKAS